MCHTDTIKKNILPLLIHNRDNNKGLDVMYQVLEDTIINLDDIPNKNNVIIELINNVKKYKIYCGGGNFYHNKLNNIN